MSTVVGRSLGGISICVALWIAVSLTSKAIALTGGPSEPVASAPQLVTQSDLVDPFTGDFRYSIPLIDLAGPYGSFPFFLNYRSGITTEQEASWIGLGWSLEAGRISRTVRSLPDDVAGTSLNRLFHQRNGLTVGAGGSVGAEVFGGDSRLLKIDANVGLTAFFDAYSGYGLSLNTSGKIGVEVADKRTIHLGISADLNTQQGTSIGATLGSNVLPKDRNKSIGASFNPRTGLQSNYWGWDQASHFRPTAVDIPQVSYFTIRTDDSLRFGPGLSGFFPSGEAKSFHSTTSYFLPTSTKAYGHLHLDRIWSEVWAAGEDFPQNPEQSPDYTLGHLDF